MWWYHAPGSGLFLRLGNVYTVNEKSVGKYNSLMLHKTLVQGFGVGSAPGSAIFQARFALKMQELKLLNYSDAMRIDSVVFPLRSPAQWAREHFSEIVHLRSTGREIQYVADLVDNERRSIADVPYLRCGWEGSRPCVADESAMVVHGGVCNAKDQYDRIFHWREEALERTCALTM